MGSFVTAVTKEYLEQGPRYINMISSYMTMYESQLDMSFKNNSASVQHMQKVLYVLLKGTKGVYVLDMITVHGTV